MFSRKLAGAFDFLPMEKEKETTREKRRQRERPIYLTLFG